MRVKFSKHYSSHRSANQTFYMFPVTVLTKVNSRKFLKFHFKKLLNVPFVWDPMGVTNATTPTVLIFFQPNILYMMPVTLLTGILKFQISLKKISKFNIVAKAN